MKDDYEENFKKVEKNREFYVSHMHIALQTMNIKGIKFLQHCQDLNTCICNMSDDICHEKSWYV